VVGSEEDASLIWRAGWCSGLVISLAHGTISFQIVKCFNLILYELGPLNTLSYLSLVRHQGIAKESFVQSWFKVIISQRIGFP